ncbi:GNAT family N-acetyltransferase [Halorubrum ezzemoulense]|jgi:GNAT superfamily N-acetyltransferase|uniref:Acetyltransferase (GNAT) family protein n=1 Tax=Halorubrum ezzemoulense TaxID=337243 RepID=A0A256JMH8_HALEZ|nr:MULTISPECIES: GNAT family N-acetyltransferase [Halorubrum]MDB2244661.1 GNAT family N-acetyltransferase [Halorubrum ezzemoulense]MDB2250868.1 GNAT family N-acetyltransferase [Halorubrum ezzemoulense]MDB2278582.1 GNAT family N-acetyltransferase [Halorubrum ezzemoulense]MDB2285256.1 GNAT family N-acetyltransferase [Halorubrum ezzemoulense]MDB2287995.1 GNAT family N-acetyltransferase [Halorubrum ezzemoulense]
MELVEADEGDLGALADRWYDLATAMEAYSSLNEIRHEDAGAVADDGFRAHLDDPSVTDYLVAVDGETVGFTTLETGTRPARERGRYLDIVNLEIDAEHRNEGYGTAVVERVEELAREADRDYLTVSCEWGNDGARRFYRDAGFEPKQVTYARSVE